MEETDVVPYLQYGVHVVGIDDGRDVVFFGNAVEQVIYDKRCLGVET